MTTSDKSTRVHSVGSDHVDVDCNSRRIRTIAASVVAAVFAIVARVIYVSLVRSEHSFSSDVPPCQLLRKIVEGEVICNRSALDSYSFDWGNPDCAGRLPDLIVRPMNENDVARTIKVATDFGMPLSYRSGGHSYTCDGIKESSAHIDLRSLDSKRLYQEDGAWYAEFGTGNTFKDLFQVIDRRRFSFVHGACHAVGVGGFYLHGGLHLNSLTSLYGWGNESVVSMKVVVASGDIHELSPDSRHPDLWRGMLQAGSNFGIATSMTIKVHERPEPRMWLFWAEMPHEAALKMFYRSINDPRVQLNIFYVNPPAFQISSNRSNTFTFQFALLHGPVDYWQNLQQSVQWFEQQGSPLSWWTIAFNAAVPKPDDLTPLGYSKAWVSSHAILRSDSACTKGAMRTLLRLQSDIVGEHRFHSFGDVDCWLLLAEMPLGKVYYEYSCPSTERYTEHIYRVEETIAGMCDDFVKYRNVPLKNVDPHVYYPNAADLLQIKARWDPNSVFGPSSGSLRELSGS